MPLGQPSPSWRCRLREFMSSGSIPRSAGVRARPRPVQANAAPHAMAAIIMDGTRFEIPVAGGEAVLDAALRAGLDLPFSCKGGMCSTCRAKVTEGSVEMEVNYSLEPWELASGFVLTCQARPTSARILVDYDQQ